MFLAVAAAFGAIISPWAILALPVAVLTGLAFTAVIEAWTVTRTKDTSLAVVYRFGLIPLFLFSGTFFPVTQLPAWIRPIAYLTPLWHGVALCRELCLGVADRAVGVPARRLPAGRAGGRDHRREPDLHQAAVCLAARYGAPALCLAARSGAPDLCLGGSMSSVGGLPLRVLPGRGPLRRAARSVGGRSSLFLVERHALVYRHTWLVFVSGVVEPLFYLLSIGVGLGHLVGSVQGISYAAFVAPALLASASMNGALFDSTFNVFFRLKYEKLYDAALATPMRAGDVALGEISWALLRGALYAVAFLVVMAAMGLVYSWWALAALPAAVLTRFAFAAAGMACTTYMRTWQDFEFVTLATLPMFLFSTTFYPLSVYPRPLQFVVECTPLYQSVVLLRDLTLGTVGPGLLWHAAYLAVLGAIGLLVAGRRIGKLLLR